MNTLSNERLEHYAANTDGPVKSMARELLALRKEREATVPVEQLKNLEHFISFWRKVQSGTIKPSNNEIDHTVWFLEGLESITAPPAQPVAVPDVDKLKEIYSLFCTSTTGSDNAMTAIHKACRAAVLKESK